LTSPKRPGRPYWFTGGFNLGAIIIWAGGVVLWLWLAGSTTLISWAQSFGTGVHVYNLCTTRPGIASAGHCAPRLAERRRQR
jgi:hypothetical protein